MDRCIGALTLPNTVIPAAGVVPYVNIYEVAEGVRVTVRDTSGKTAAMTMSLDDWSKLKDRINGA